jgi:hypothetical protein
MNSKERDRHRAKRLAGLLRRSMTERRINQQNYCDWLIEAGNAGEGELTYGALQRWLDPNRGTMPNLDNFALIARAHGLTLDELFEYLNSDEEGSEISDSLADREKFEQSRLVTVVSHAPAETKVEILRNLLGDLKNLLSGKNDNTQPV